ncbi:MAG: hypothetical protein KC619_26340 [Myxococcales bacterium]|nr:hypothetical protein [Myxococcales bacterium]
MSDGRKVASGRLRVDAARAVDKLRDYQLPDPTLWVLEVVRAAVAFGASAIRVSGDADDVRVAWDGPTPDPEAMARLFDELVDPAPKRERRPLRLLATGVNTALGLDPRWVDVIATDGEGGALAVRYSPRLLETKDGAASALRGLKAEPRVPPREAPARGGLVHLRRLPLWDAVPLMIGYGEPRELSVVGNSCDEIRVPITVGRSELGHARSHEDLLRLALGDDLDGYLALIDPTFAAATARLEAAELGVVLARYELPLPMLESPRAPVPIRLFVDAPRMPTNASRSAVRLDETPMHEALARAKERLPKLVERLARELGDEAEHAWSTVQRERLRAAAIQLLATHAAGPDWRARLVGGSSSLLAPLLELPLLRDALGRPRAPTSFGPFARGLERVHLGRDPLPTELEPWLGDSLWVPPGDPSAVLLGDWVPERATDLAKLAARHQAKRRQWTDQKRRDPVLSSDAANLLMVPIKAPGRSLKSCVPPACFEVEGLAGEVALRDPRAPAGGVSLLVDGRPLARFGPEARSIEGVATCAGLTPTVDYRSVEDDAAFRALRVAVLAAAVVAHEALALRLAGRSSRGDRAREVAVWLSDPGDADAARVQGLLRHGVGVALELLALGERDVDVQSRRDAALRAFLASRSPLADVPIWPCVGGARATTREVFAQASAAPRVMGYHLGRAIEGDAPKGRRIYELDLAELQVLRAFAPDARFIDYGPLLSRRRSANALDLAREVLPPLGAVIGVERDGVTGVLAWGIAGKGSLEVRHLGRRMARDPLDQTPPARVLVEDAMLVPTAELELGEGLPRYPIPDWTLRLARAYVDALGGKPPANLLLGADDAHLAVAARAALLAWIAKAPNPDVALGKRRFERLAQLPLVARLGRSERTTPKAIAEEAGDGPIEWVSTEEAATFDLGGWHPIQSTPEERDAFAAILGRPIADGTERLAGLRRHAARAQALERHRARDPVDATIRWSEPKVEVKGQGIRHAMVRIAPGGEATVRVLIETRPFLEMTRGDAVPIEVVLDLPPSAADDDFVTLSALGERRVEHVLGAGGRALLQHVASTSPSSLTAAPEVRRLLEAWCVRIRMHGANAADREGIEALAAAPAFETLTGTRVALEEAASDGGTLRVAAWNEPWIHPAEGERASALDRPVIKLPDDAPEGFRDTLRALWGERPIRDVTSKVARLQSERRVARGLLTAPRLEGTYDARFRFELGAVLDEANHAETLEALGIGECALADASRSRVTFVAGERRRVIESGLIPAVHVAAHRTDLDAKKLASAELVAQAEKALETLIGLVVRRVVDATPSDQLPEWTRRALLAACLAGGRLHFERLEHTPILPTSVGGWVTPAQALEQAEHFGAVWTTKLARDLAPLDPARVALRLDAAQTEQLSVYAAAEVADEELLLDEKARRNLEQPPVASLEPTFAERAGALRVIEVSPTDTSTAHGTLTVLDPGHASLRGFYPSRSFQPLGRQDDFARWPCVVRVDDPAFTPDRTWSAPLPDEVQSKLRSRLRSQVDRALVELVPYPIGKLVGTRVISSLAKEIGLPADTGLEGVGWLEDEPAAGALTLHDPGGERVVAAVGPSGAPLPVHGRLLVSVPLDERALRVLSAKLHERVVERLADRLSGEGWKRRPEGLAQLFAAIRLDTHPASGALDRVVVPSMVPTTTVTELLRMLFEHGLVPVSVPEEVDLARSSLDGRAVIADDGSPEVAAVLRFLEGRALGWRNLVRAKVLGDVEQAAMEELVRDEPRFAPPPAPSRAPLDAPGPPPRSRLEQTLLDRWNALPLPAVQDARVDGRRKRPAIGFVGDHMVIAGRHPVVRRALAELEAGSARAAPLIALLLASGSGALRRGASAVGNAGEHGFLTALMRDEAAPQ